MTKHNMESGHRVKVRCADGRLHNNVVWRVVNGLAYLCSDRQYEALREGQWAPPPIGFPLEDVEFAA